jgi:hypothetical protein
LAISNGNNAGAISSAPRRRSATAASSGSPNGSAASEEASTTSTAIAIRADHGGSFARPGQAELSDFGQNLVCGERSRADRLLEDRHQFPLGASGGDAPLAP